MARAKAKTCETVSTFAETMDMYYKLLKQTAVSVFEWRNLPRSIDSRYFENVLFEQGKAIYFQLPEIVPLPSSLFESFKGNIFAMAGGGMGEPDIYGRLTGLFATTANGRQIQNLDADKSVVVYDNVLEYPLKTIARHFARRLAHLEITIDLNLMAQRTPIVMAMDDNTNFSYEIVKDKIIGGEMSILTAKNRLDVGDIKALSLGANYIADKCEIQKHQYLNQWYTIIGVENAHQDKRERLVADEVSGNDGGIEVFRNARQITRDNAVKEINEKLGSNISVRFRSDFISQINAPDKLYALEGLGGLGDEEGDE